MLQVQYVAESILIFSHLLFARKEKEISKKREKCSKVFPKADTP
jgi:hypothetical protein